MTSGLWCHHCKVSVHRKISTMVFWHFSAFLLHEVAAHRTMHMEGLLRGEISELMGWIFHKFFSIKLLLMRQVLSRIHFTYGTFLYLSIYTNVLTNTNVVVIVLCVYTIDINLTSCYFFMEISYSKISRAWDSQACSSWQFSFLNAYIVNNSN